MVAVIVVIMAVMAVVLVHVVMIVKYHVTTIVHKGAMATNQFYE